MLSVLLLCASAGLVGGLQAGLLPATRAAAAPRIVGARMAAADVVAKKSAVVDVVKGSMEKSALMFCVRTEGIEVNDFNMMRQKFPEEVTIRCVKNTLMKRASDKVEKFQGGEDMYEYSNYWFFVPEAHVRDTFTTWDDWTKETKIVRARTPCLNTLPEGRAA